MHRSGSSSLSLRHRDLRISSADFDVVIEPPLHPGTPARKQKLLPLSFMVGLLFKRHSRPGMAGASSLISRQLQGWICRSMVTRQGVVGELLTPSGPWLLLQCGAAKKVNLVREAVLLESEYDAQRCYSLVYFVGRYDRRTSMVQVPSST